MTDAQRCFHACCGEPTRKEAQTTKTRTGNLFKPKGTYYVRRRVNGKQSFLSGMDRSVSYRSHLARKSVSICRRKLSEEADASAGKREHPGFATDLTDVAAARDALRDKLAKALEAAG